MLHLFAIPLPWYIVGPLMGLTVTGLYATVNKHLGISGSYVQLVTLAQRRTTESWRLWFLVGLVVGSAAAAILGSNSQTGLSYGKLSQLLPLGALVPLLFTGGIMIGFGARWAGGCTSGHGLSGCSTRSPGSMAAICVFMVTAVAATLILHVATGGKL